MEEILKRQKIFIVDDNTINIKVLSETLHNRYDISFAKDGHEALEIIPNAVPDLILLDIMMPGIDGYEVCRRLKNERHTKNIPVIFITARDTNEDEKKGFDCGAVDYIKKPFRAEIVLARIKTHLELKLHRDKLSGIVTERTSQLIHSDRLATIGTIASAVAHEIKNPLFYISGNIELIQQYVRENNFEKINEKVERVFDGINRISRLTESLNGYSRHDATTLLICSIDEIVKDAVVIISHTLRHRNISLSIDDIPDSLKIYCDFQKMSQIFVNLINNAIDAIGDNEGFIKISAEKNNDKIVVAIVDNGSGISEENINDVFTPYITSKEKNKGTGLGLFIVKRIIEDHNGTIALSSKAGEGTDFTITLPEAVQGDFELK